MKERKILLHLISTGRIKVVHMIALLSRFFIKAPVGSHEERTAYGILCGVVGILLNLILFGAKCFAGILSGSISIIADAFNNLSDALSSVVTLLGFKLSAMQPDREHPWGHGRYEYISGLIVSMLIILMGFELAKSAVNKILFPEPVVFSVIIAVILALSILVKLYMAFYNYNTGKKIGSAALKATATDSLGDTIATAVVLIATVLGNFTAFNIDGWCGTAVSLMVFVAGIRAAKETLSPLLGNPPSPELVQEITDLVLSYPEIEGIHDLMVHDYGPGRIIISLHAEVSDEHDMLDAHDIIDNIERQLNTTFRCTSVIHMDPIVTSDEHRNRLLSVTQGLMKEIHPDITVHDFRLVTGATHTNLIFDAVIPYSCDLSNAEIHHLITEKVAAIPDGTYYAVVCLEKSYV